MTNTGPSPSFTPPSPRAIDLDDTERALRTASAADLTEAKEAIVEGLVQLAIQRCTGDGTAGDLIFGAKPSTKLVSGFLLPRFDASGQEDETSDIHLATMGIDLQIAATQAGEAILVPGISIYVRLLPTWEELTDPRHDMMPRSELSRQTRQTVEDRARQYINEAIAALPPLDDVSEPDERPGDATAEAQQARELADQAEQNAVEQGDVEARGHSRAAQAAAQRLETVATARRQAAQQRLAARRERNAAVAAIRREAFTRAFAELGIRVLDMGHGGAQARSLQPNDLAADIGNDDPQTALPDPLEEADLRTRESVPPTDGEPTAVAAGAAILLRPGAGVLEDRIAEPQAIPMKWRRFRLDLGEFRFDCHDPTSRDAATAAFATRVLDQARTVLGAWIDSAEGQRDAYQPNERILPSNFVS